jgi:ectoine hydroxylase-related dioxygenase (phytanoyl-CoA dioxygenase family)|tara:strand:+ start:4844 stop:5728 length:885 start_codon:yes stop_codon:yes gene_type:complete
LAPDKKPILQLDDSLKAGYLQDGYLVLPSFFSAAEIAPLCSETERLIEAARGKAESDAVHDLEAPHQPDGEPRVRRIKDPVQQFDVYREFSRNEKLLSVVRFLIGDNVRFHNSKINIKAAGIGAAVEWHQDWAFYPHTNDAVLEVGIALEDLCEDNGPLLVIPGSHLGPVYDHHVEGTFCGAIGASEVTDLVQKSVALTGPAGSVTIHHARTIHGSAMNRSDRSRPLLLIGYAAADAWPLMGVSDFDTFNDYLVCGDECLTPRLQEVPVRMPLPSATFQGSIYENQRTLSERAF